MTKKTAKFSFMEELDAYEQRQTAVHQLADKLQNIINLEVKPDFNYKSGLFVGLVKLMSRSFKHRSQIAAEFGVSERLFELFNEAFGSPSYVDKNGVITEEMPMDIARTVEIFRYLEEQWNIPSSATEYADFTEEHIERVYNRSRQYAEDQLLLLEEETTYEE